MNSLLTALIGVSAMVSLAAIVFSVRAAQIAWRAHEYVNEKNARSLSIKKLTDIETELTEHADSIESLHKSLHKLRSRIGMRKLAEERKNAEDDGMPDPTTHPEEWKTAMRAKLFGKPVNNGD